MRQHKTILSVIFLIMLVGELGCTDFIAEFIEQKAEEELGKLFFEQQRALQQSGQQSGQSSSAGRVTPADLAAVASTEAKIDFTTFIKYENPEHKFSVSLPSTPNLEVQDVPTEIGSIKIYMYSSASESTQFLLGVSDYPKELVAQSNSKTMLEGARDGAVSNAGGILVADAELLVGQFPARRVKIKISPGFVINGIMVMAGARLYQIMVVAPGNNVDEALLNAYFDSFVINQKPKK